MLLEEIILYNLFNLIIVLYNLFQITNVFISFLIYLKYIILLVLNKQSSKNISNKSSINYKDKLINNNNNTY